MAENNTTNPSGKDELKKQKKQPNKNSKPTFSETVADYKAEFKKIVWPTRQELAKKNSDSNSYFFISRSYCFLYGYGVFSRI